MTARNESDNPYFRLPTVFDPDKYYGALGKVHLILEAVSGLYPSSMELFGLPGMGKTTLLRYLAAPHGAFEKQRDKLQLPFKTEPYRLFPILVEFRSLPTHTHPFTYMYLRFHAEYSGFKSRGPEEFKKRLPDFGEQLLPDTPEMAVEQLETKLRQLVDCGIRPIFLLDDYDLAFEKITVAQTTRLRPWRELLSFIMVTERSLEQVNPDALGSPFFQTLPLMRVGGLSTEEAAKLLTTPAENEKKPFPPEDVQFLLEKVGLHPYLLIVAGKVLWDMREMYGILENEKTSLTEDQRLFLVGRLQDEFSRSYQLYRDRLDPSEREALQKLAKKEKNLKDIHYVALASLEQKGLVKYDSQNPYILFSPMFETFVIRSTESHTQEHARLDLTGLEESLYTYLRDHMDRICSFEELWQNVWDQGKDESQDQMRRRIQVTASRLRTKLQEANKENIVAIRDQGYRLTN